MKAFFAILLSFMTMVVMAQSPFKPLPKPKPKTIVTVFYSHQIANQAKYWDSEYKPQADKYVPVAYKVVIVTDSTLSTWRIISVAAAYAEPNNILMAGVGYGYQRLKYDYADAKWLCQWSISPVAFAGGSVAPSTPSSVMSVGVLAGVDNNLVLAGPIYNFGLKQFGVAVSIGINFNN